MLQHNAAVTLSDARTDARRAHAAHAVVVGAHVLCCGVPAAMMLLAAGAGASIGLSAVTRFFAGAHEIVHSYEIWILAASACFVLVGGLLEWRAHRGRKLSRLFAVSLLCFAINAGVVFTHQGEAHAEQIALLAR